MNGDMPNFFILGAAKAGTTSLHYYLQQHPKVFLSAVKEPNFFGYDPFYAEGIHKYVARHFSCSCGFPARGEATPTYFHQYETVIPRMQEAFAAVSPRFLVILRDPVDRAWSHYLHRKRNCTEPETFERALALENERLQQNPQAFVGYFRPGLYAKQLTAWFRHFPRDRFLIGLTEDLRAKPTEFISNICSFLGVDPPAEMDLSEKKNRASEPRIRWLMQLLNRPNLVQRFVKSLLSRHTQLRLSWYIRELNLRPYTKELPRINEETAASLRTLYAEDLERLEEMIERDLSKWINGNSVHDPMYHDSSCSAERLGGKYGSELR